MTDEELNVGSVAVSVVPDATGFDEKLQAQIRDVTAKVRLKLEDAAAKAGIAETTKDRTTKVGVKVEGADKAAADIDRVARTRTATIKVKADTKEAEAKISALKLLAVPALSLGAPLVGSALGTSLGLSSVLGPAAGGLGLFGLIARRGISQTNQDSQTLATLQNAVQTARTAAARQAAVKAYTTQYNSESPTQLAYINSERALSKQVNAFATSPAVFKPVSEAMKVMADVLPKLQPLIQAVGDSLTKALTSVDRLVQSGSFDKFINGFASLAGKSLDKILPALGNFFKGFIELEGAMSGTGLSFLDKFANAGKSFANWGANGGTASFKNFISYMQTEIPKVHQTLKDLGGALIDIFKALSPIGNVTLTVVDAFAKLVEQIAGLGKFGQLAIEGAGLLFFLKQVNGLVDNITASAAKMGEKLAAASAANIAASEGASATPGAALGNAGRGMLGSVQGTLASQLQSKYGIAAGLGSAVLGVVSSESKNKAVNILGDAASGALAGFAVSGSPVGAAIGGAGGALLGLVTALGHTHDAAKTAASDVSAYAAALDKAGHANTDAIRQQVINDLQNTPGAIKTLQGLGYSDFQIGQAGSGQDNGAVASKIAAQLAHYNAEIKRMQDAYTGGDVGGGAGQQYTDQMKALQDKVSALEAVSKALHDTTTTTVDAIQKDREQITVTQQFHDAVKGLPSKVVTQLEAANVTPTTNSVINLLHAYGATPAKIQTVLAAMNVPATISQIKSVEAAANHLNGKTVAVRVTADIKAAVNALSKIIPGIGNLAATVNGGHAMGGYIVGPGSGTSDEIPAMLSNGEYVINARATAKHRRLLEAINAEHFANGGPVLTPGQVSNLPSSVTGSTRTHRTRAAHGLAPLTSLELRVAQHAFTLQEGMSDKAVTDKFFNFLTLLEKHGGHVTAAFSRLEKAALANEHQWTKVNDKLKAVQSRMATDQSSAAGSFMGNIFAGSADYMRLQLNSDVKNENAMMSAIAGARKKGLSGEFGAQLAASGNLALAQQFSVMSPSMIKQMQALYARREAGSATLGNLAASFDQSEATALRNEMAGLTKQLAVLSEKADGSYRQQQNTSAAVQAALRGTVVRVQPVGHNNLPMR